jgi:VWFA-related protein
VNWQAPSGFDSILVAAFDAGLRSQRKNMEDSTRQYGAPMSRHLRLLLFLSLAVATVVAQSTTPPPLLHLRAIVRDPAGQPITDLSSADFKIWDQGKSQTIFAFRRQATKVAAPLSPHEYTNRPGGVMPHHIAILVDLLNQNRGDRVETWHTLSKSLSQLELGDSVYVYLVNLEGELVPVHTAETNAAADNTQWQDVAHALDHMMNAERPARPIHIGREDQVKKTYHQIEVLAKTLSALPGRRDIVWITDGIPSVYNPNLPCSGDWVDCALYVPHLAVTLTQANVTVNPLSYSGDLSTAVDPEMEHKRPQVYAVDLGGLGTVAMSQSPDIQSSSPKAATSMPHSEEPHPGFDLAQMALLTGGRTFFKTDIRSVLKEVAANDSSFYEIDYDPSAANWDNKFHRIRITCERKGVKLQVRERYFALPDARQPAERMKAALVDVLHSPHDAADIGIRSKIAPLEGGKAGVHMDISINPSDILLRDQGSKFSGAIYFLISDRGPSGPLGEPTMASFNLDLTPAQYDAILREGIRIAQDHPTNDAAQAVRIIVLDQSTEAVSSLTIPLKQTTQLN